ncbi:MAG: LD-carboxypeptidase [Chitinophagaceae bacterium]|nr:LD-carboxypeptidase [Chitinophagaceae bacterium]
MFKIPPYLKKGDTIGIVCPAGYMPVEKAQTCISTLQQWGYKVKIGSTLGGSSLNYFSGTDEERLNDLQEMLDDKEVQAILCGRGGYGVSRIIDYIDFSGFKKKPKWLIGFSDITVLHTHIHTRYKTATLHAPMAGAFNDGGAGSVYVQSLKKALRGKKAHYTADAHALNRKGAAEGLLVGGNLSLLAHVTGSVSGPDTRNKILFIEDVGEYIYNVDRMLRQLKRAGKLDRLAGLIVGGFTDMKDTDRPFGKTVYEVIYEIVKEYSYPVCFDFPVSHDRENYALKCGVQHTLSIGRKVTLKES